MNRLLLALVFILSYPFFSLAQEQAVAPDTTKTSSITSIAAIDTLFTYEEPKNPPAQSPKSTVAILTQIINRAQQYAFDLSEIKIDLADNLDTTDMSVQLPEIQLIAERIKLKTERDYQYLNHRYLVGMENLVETVGDLNKSFLNKIQARVAVLDEVGVKLHIIKSDSLFAMTLRDTSLIPAINSELKMLKNSLKTVDSIYLDQEILTARFQAKVSENALVFLSLKQYLNQNKKRLDKQYWTKEINYIWEPSNYTNSTDSKTVVKESMELNMALMKAYMKRTGLISVFSLIILIGAYLKIKASIKEISKQKDFASLILDRVKYFKRHTFTSTLLFLLPIFLIIFNKPPLVFISILSLLMVVASSLLVKEQFGAYFKNLWFIFITPYIILALSSLNWKVIYQERWFILVCSVIFLVMGILVLINTKALKNKHHTFLIYLSLFLIGMEGIALIANIMGRFNLAKTYTVTGAILFYRGIGLYLFVNVFLEAVYLFIEVSKKETDGFTSYFDFQDLQKRMKGFLYVFATAIWVYGVIWHLGYYDEVYNWVYDFLLADRKLGDTIFQFGSILLFITILYLSTFLANNIAYFASVKDQKTATSRKQRLGSSVLLIRLAVLTVGFLIGMTAAKIPFDKIAIVLGALSVGIGFGLQTIINNLVSGVILAFERPIQIGDEIQVGENSGTVKEVGIRASKIQAYDGSEIVVPNGDLLSQSLINWTLSDKKRRIELIIGVGYGSDMKLVHSVLEDVLSRERILKVPTPKVYMQTFNDSSVDFRVLFWVESMDIWIDVRAEVMSTIFEKFAENNIEIPFPKRDLYLKSVPSNWKENISKPGEDISPKRITEEAESLEDENKKSSEE
jgi:small-conductance mechanosensitive channel